MNQSSGVSCGFGGRILNNEQADKLSLLKTKYNPKNSMSADKRKDYLNYET
jgi:hypothetical protein